MKLKWKVIATNLDGAETVYTELYGSKEEVDRWAKLYLTDRHLYWEIVRP